MCDQSTINHCTLKLLNVFEDFIFINNEIFLLLDALHLIEYIRNNWIVFCYINGNNIILFDDIEKSTS